jgi:hypothetical protein
MGKRSLPYSLYWLIVVMSTVVRRLTWGDAPSKRPLAPEVVGVLNVDKTTISCYNNNITNVVILDSLGGGNIAPAASFASAACATQ